MEEGSIMLEVFEVGDLIRYRSFKANKSYGIVLEAKPTPRGTMHYKVHWIDNGVESFYSNFEIEKA
jgi:hypothetical protein